MMIKNRRTFLRDTTLVGGGIALRGLASGLQDAARAQISPSRADPEMASNVSVRQHFQAPSRKYGPIARWWWPGNNVTDQELRREIDVLARAGFGGAEIQPFIEGLDVKSFSDAEQQRIQSYDTPSFFRHVGTAVEEARDRGMFIDYTFGSGWPFGGGTAITPELAAIELRSTHLSLEGPTKLRQRLQVPSVTDGDPWHQSAILEGLPSEWAERLRKRTKVVAVVALRGQDARWDFNLPDGEWNYNLPGGGSWTLRKTGQLDGETAVDLTARLQLDGTLDWDVPPGTWQLFVFCSLPTGQRVDTAAGKGPQLVIDHMSSEAFAAHAKRVGGNAIPFIGKFFGNGLRAIFCDSLEVAANLFWSDDFPAEFRRRRGYDLLPYLPILKVQSHEEPFGKFVDLPIFDIAGVGDRVRHDYRRTVSDLMIERFYEQFNQWAHEHKLLSRTQAHGSPTEVLRVYGEANIPETEDLFDSGCYDFLKMAASAAHVFGRAIVGSESFVWSNALYQTTPEKMKLAADQLFTAGVNAIVYHGFPYIMPDVPAPGWHPFSGMFSGCFSSQFNEFNPFWPHLAQINGYITRVQYLSQIGTNVAAVALYWNDLAHGATEAPPTPNLNQAIMDAGYNYDHINAPSLLACSVRDRVLVTVGGARYRTLVFPTIRSLDRALAEKLQSFASAGLSILFAGQVPFQADGLLDNVRNTQRVQTAMEQLRSLDNVYFASRIDEAIAMLRKAADPNIRFHSSTLPFIQKRIGNSTAYFLRNPSDEAQHLDAEFEAEGKPELWDPWTGRMVSIAGSRRKDNWVEIELDLQPLSSALIVFGPDSTAPSAVADTNARALKHAQAIGSDGWKLTTTGMFPSGKTETIRRVLQSLIDWSLDSELRGFSGRGSYLTTFTVSAADADSRHILDLGNVKDVAEVAVNGKHAATLLLRPYRTDITELVHSGENQLEVTVINSLYNSMVMREPRTFRPGPTQNPSGLLSSGLIGPVQLRVMD